jgi:hypothetical protein
MGIKSYCKTHGIGISTVTTSTFPLLNKTERTLPEVKPNETWATTVDMTNTPDPKIPRFLNLQKKNKVAAKANPHQNTPGSQAMQVRLTSNSKKKFTYDISDNTFRKLLAEEEYVNKFFKGSRGGVPSGTDRHHLEGLLQALREKSVPKDGLPEKLKGGEMVMATQALATVCKERPNGIADIVRGMNCLMGLNLLDAIRNPGAATAPGNPPAELRCPNVGTENDLPVRHATAAYDQTDFDCAWRIAQVLGSTTDGFEMLKRITVRPNPPNPTHESALKHDDDMLRVYLQATREMRNQELQANPHAVIVNDPHQVYHKLDRIALQQNGGVQLANIPGRNRPAWDGNIAQAYPNPRANLNHPLGAVAPTELARWRGETEMTVLQKALYAVKDHLELSRAHATNAGINDGNGARQAAHKFEIPEAWRNGASWAITFVQSGIYSDDPNQANPASEFYRKLEGRTSKSATWARRAFDKATGKWPKFKEALKLNPHQNKSPLNAYNDLGKGTNAIGFHQSEAKSGIHDARDIKENLIDNVRTAIRASGAGTAAVPAALFQDGNAAVAHVAANGQPDNRTIRSVVRLALLDYHFEKTSLPRYIYGEKLDQYDLDKVKDKVFAYFGGNGRNNGNLGQAQLTSMLQELTQQNNAGYSPRVLVDWAADAGAPFTTVDGAYNQRGAAGAQQAGQPDWPNFGNGIARVVFGDVPVTATPNLNKTNGGGANVNANITTTADRFQEAIASQELGQKFSFSSGGTKGFKTGNITKAITQIVTLGTASVKVNVGYEKQRTALFEGGTLTTGHELIMGTESIHKWSGGLGGSVLPGSVNRKTGSGWVGGLSVGGDVSGSIEFSKRKCALLRFARTVTSSNGDHAQNQKLGGLAGMIIEPDLNAARNNGRALPCQPADQLSILKRACQQYPDLSLSYLDTDTESRKAGAGVIGSAGFSIPWIRLALVSIGGGHDRKRSKTQWAEQGGALHVSKKISQKEAKWSVNAGGPLAAFIPGGVGLPGVLFGDVSAEVKKVAYRQTDSYISEHGEFHPRTYRTRTFATAQDCFDYFSKEAAAMAVDKARYYQPAKYHESPKTAQAAQAALAAKQATVQNAQAGQQALVQVPQSSPQDIHSLSVAHEAERNQIIQDEYKRLMRHFQEQIDRAELNQIYQLYYEPKQEMVDAVNTLKGIRDTAFAAGDMKTAYDTQDTIQKALEDDNNWHHGFLVDQDEVAVTESKGWNFGPKNQKVNSARFNRIRTWF